MLMNTQFPLPVPLMASITVTLMQTILLLAAAAAAAAVGISTTLVQGRELELEVLIAFRKAITVDPKDALSDWISFNSINGSTKNSTYNYCSWKGVQCLAGTSQVKGISLIGLDLQGTITPLLGKLPHLSFLNLSFNAISGPIPAELANCSTLRKLDLAENQLQGELTLFLNSSHGSRLSVLSAGNNKLSGNFPPNICQALPMVQQLNLSHNQLSGHAISGLSQCAMLHLLDLSTNHFTAAHIPATAISNLCHLSYLDLSSNGFISSSSDYLLASNNSRLSHLNMDFNQLSGTIPSSWFHLPLHFLSLGYNDFTGTLSSEHYPLFPSSLEYLQLQSNHLQGQPLHLLLNCSNLSFLALTNNSFSEELPSDLGSRHPSLSILVLIFNNFFGHIPASLGNCSNLQVLIIGFNYAISGYIPQELFRPKLQKLDLQYNALQGSIPPQVGNSSALVSILLNNNHNLTGNLPSELGHLTNLQQSILEFNQFKGGIPKELGNCTKLIVFTAYRNFLTGSIPSTVGHLSVLEHLILDNNQLSGNIPLSLSNCTRLTNISFNNNLLQGSILAANFPSMLYFDLSNNQLTGPIPSQLGSMTQVELIDLSFNNLSGSIPGSLSSCVNLYSLKLSSNNLSGSIPTQLGNSLNSLLVLNLSMNSLSNQIPSQLGNLRLLQVLDLSHNSFSGKIPSTLGMLSNMSFLNLSDNKLEGPIPSNGSLSAFNRSSFLDNPGLCSISILNRPCPKSSHSSKKRTIIIAVAASGSVLLLLFLLVAFLIRRRQPGIRMDDLGGPQNFYRFTLREIVEATNNFSEENIIGSGGSGTVYKGTMKDGRVLAFKKMRTARNSSESVFLAEAKSMAAVKHRNLVKIIGCLRDLDNDILVLEYISNGNLSDYLHQNREHPWEDRLQIIKGIASGLAYLHHSSPNVIIHMDVKPNNILLDSELEPHITDFGLSRIMQEAATHTSTQNMKGSLGYMDPEYASSGRVSTKCDVYSFGIVLLEILTCKSPSDPMFVDGKTLPKWVQSCLSADDYEEFLRLCIGSLSDTPQQREQALKLLKMGIGCTKEDPKVRPTMNTVCTTLGLNPFIDTKALKVNLRESDGSWNI